MYVTHFQHSMCRSQTVCVCHRQSVSVTDSLSLSQTICLCHTQSLSVTDRLCLSQKVYVYHRHSDLNSDYDLNILHPISSSSSLIIVNPNKPKWTIVNSSKPKSTQMNPSASKSDLEYLANGTNAKGHDLSEPSWIVMNCHELSKIAMHHQELSWIVINYHKLSQIVRNHHESLWSVVNCNKPS